MVYRRLNAGGTDFLFVGVGYHAGEESVAWADSVIKQYPNDGCILLFHGYLHLTRGLFEEGPMLYEKLVAPNPNVRMVLCGHFRKTAYLCHTFDTDEDGTVDRSVNVMLCNFQNYSVGSQIRLLMFDPASRSVCVDTFSTLYPKKHFRDETLHKNPFELDNAF